VFVCLWACVFVARARVHARTHARLPVSLSRRLSASASVYVNSLRDADERAALEDYKRLWCERFSAERLQNIAEGGDRSDPLLQQVDELEHKIEGARMLAKDFDTYYPTWEADVHEFEESYVQDDDEKIEELLVRIKESTMAAISRSALKKRSLSFSFKNSFKKKVAPEDATPSDVKRSRSFRRLESFESPEPLADAYIEETLQDVEEIPEECMDHQAEPLEKAAQIDLRPIGESSRPPSASIFSPIPGREHPTTILEQIQSRQHTIQGMGYSCDFVSDHHRVLVFENCLELDEELTQMQSTDAEKVISSMKRMLKKYEEHTSADIKKASVGPKLGSTFRTPQVMRTHCSETCITYFRLETRVFSVLISSHC
jgi:hypothetical protein